MIKSLKPLVMMQLKDKIDFSWLRSKKDTVIKIILSILSFVLITVGIFGLMKFSIVLKLFHILDIIPVSVIIVVFTIMEILGLLSCTYGIMKSLYFARDNQVLLTMPVSTNQVFVSKIIVYFLYELKRNIYYVLPLFFAYGFVSGFSFWFFLWAPFCIILLSILNICIASLFSIFAMLITIFLKNFSFVKIILFITISALSIWGVVEVINLIPPNLDIIGRWGSIFAGIQDFLEAFVIYAWPFTKITQMIVGGYVGLQPILFTMTTLWVFLSLIGISFITMGLTFLLSRPLFFKMASKPFEYRKNTNIKIKKNIKVNPFVSSVFKETTMIFRTSDDFSILLGCAVAMPILILLLNRIFNAMSTRLDGKIMTISFNLLIMILIALSSNTRIASIYSREGSAYYLVKSRPVNDRNSLIAKLIPNAVVMTISIIISVIIFNSFSSLSIINSILFGLALEFIYLTHLIWSAELDIMNPQSLQYATTGSHVSNPNETKSSAIMFFLAFLFFGISLFLGMENINVAWIKVFMVILALFIFRGWLFLSKIKYYYKEK